MLTINQPQRGVLRVLLSICVLLTVVFIPWFIGRYSNQATTILSQWIAGAVAIACMAGLLACIVGWLWPLTKAALTAYINWVKS